MANPDDAELLKRYVRAGAEDAFAEFVQRYLGLVYHAALRQVAGDAPAAEDVTQRVFTLVARKAATLQHHAALAAWLHTTTRHVANETMRAERRRRAREQEAYVMNELLSRNDSEPEWKDLRPVIDAAVSELNERDREAVLLRYFVGLPLAEIGGRFRISENAARMRVERALERLREAMARRGVTSAATALGAVLGNEAAGAALPATLGASVVKAALASAATAGAIAPLAGALGFMSTTKGAVSAAIVCAALGVGSAFHYRAEARQAESERARALAEWQAFESRVSASDARWREAEQRARAAEARSEELQREITAAARAARPAGAASDDEQLDRFIASQPELQELYVRQQTIRFPERYGPLYVALKLTNDQIAAFERIMTRFAQAKIDVPVAAIQQGLAKNSPATAKLLAEAQEQRDRELRALLGASGFEEFQSNEKYGAWRHLADTLASRLYYTETPLSVQTGEELTRLTVENGRRNRGQVNWPELIADAGKILSPAQLAVLENHREQLELGARVYAFTKQLHPSTDATSPDSLRR